MTSERNVRVDVAIQRKASCANGHSVDAMHHALRRFTDRIGFATFGALVLDYDGTLVDTKHRFSGPTAAVTVALTRLLEAGMLLGIATGRGQSVRNDLARVIPVSLHRQVLIGYYNGGVVAPLWDRSKPERSEIVGPSLAEAAAVLEEAKELLGSVSLTKRKTQITVQSKRDWPQGGLWSAVTGILSKHCVVPPRVVASSHSVDILGHGVSKLAVVEEIRARLTNLQGGEVLSIGDRGHWPGNDFELLALPFSLSVDEVSPALDSCWNLASEGNFGSSALLEYLSWLRPEAMGGQVVIPMDA